MFAGFLPSKAVERQHAVHTLAQETRAVVLLEAPHRILALEQALTVLGTRRVTVGRELTKQFEHIHTLPAQELSDWLQAQSERQKGEFVLVIHDAPVPATTAAQPRVEKVRKRPSRVATSCWVITMAKPKVADAIKAKAMPAPIWLQCAAAPKPEAAPNTSSAMAKPMSITGMAKSTARSARCLYNTRAQMAVDNG